MIVQLRQRTLQYELLETRAHMPNTEWNDIREVANPATGFFAPVDFAVRRGWITLGERNEYVDPSTGASIPLDMAYALGRIRLASDQCPTDTEIEPSLPLLLLIERIFLSWRRTQLVSIVDTARGIVLTPEAAVESGILEITGQHIQFLNTMTDKWLSIEEAVGRQMIQVVAIEQSSSNESSTSEDEELLSCRIFQLTHLCPGGEPGVWMAPTEAVRLGVFQWETGDVAADWPARPLLRHADASIGYPGSAFIPTRWCSFLTAKHAGWLRLSEEPEPQRWIATHSVPYQEPNSVILSRQIKLVAYTSEPVDDEPFEIDNTSVFDTAQLTISPTTMRTGTRAGTAARARSEDLYRNKRFFAEHDDEYFESDQHDSKQSGRSQSHNPLYTLNIEPVSETINDNEYVQVHSRRRCIRRIYSEETRRRYFSGDRGSTSGSLSPIATLNSYLQQS